MFLLYHHFLRLKSLRGSHPFLQPSQDGVVSSRAEPQKEDELQEGQDVTNQRHLFCPQLRKGWDSAWLNQMHWFLRKTKLCMKFIIQMHCFSQIDLETILQCLPTWEAHQPGGFWLRSWFNVTGKTAGSTATPNFNCFIKNKSLSPRNVECKNHKNPRYWMGKSMVSSGFSLNHIQCLPFETARRWSPTSNFQTFLRAMKVKTSKPPGAAA